MSEPLWTVSVREADYLDNSLWVTLEVRVGRQPFRAVTLVPREMLENADTATTLLRELQSKLEPFVKGSR